MALPLLPEPVIEDTFDELIKNLSAEMKKIMNGLIEYFQGQWFVKVPVIQWCVHGLAMRTNNNAEGIHFSFTPFITFTSVCFI
jgi:hypothetical protein